MQLRKVTGQLQLVRVELHPWASLLRRHNSPWAKEDSVHPAVLQTGRSSPRPRRQSKVEVNARADSSRSLAERLAASLTVGQSDGGQIAQHGDRLSQAE
mmetsp:Transcript_36730/g.84540  ORF Transcript_36730/g.84540 Transcript_36730/m.84540 type:complete len:99 (+) Transcript_36730:3799-4095(+)